MHSLRRSVGELATEKPVIPEVFKGLTRRQVTIRRGEVSMIAGAPGAGKSTLALKLAVGSGVPTLYFSADTHKATMTLRCIAMLSGYPQKVTEGYMVAKPEWAAQVLASADHISWCFDPAPSLQDVEEEILVYREVNGQDPQLIVIDNAVDVTFESGDEFSSLRALMREVKWWARETNAALLLLHHTSEAQFRTQSPCPPRHAIHGKVSQIPALILTVASTQSRMFVAPVKNRYGPADPSGNVHATLAYDPSTMFLGDLHHD